jgi:hypothetical protein
LPELEKMSSAAMYERSEQSTKWQNVLERGGDDGPGLVIR